mmetsp:Transcript_26824/g.67961  ORF Transcript_26824/g.67961 Transcript_26824/m.67961 type:complete len:182 (-) Transcript_26824:756-1301(-)
MQPAPRWHSALGAHALGCLLAFQNRQSHLPPPHALAAGGPAAANPMACIVRSCGRVIVDCARSASCARGIACAGTSAGDPLAQVRCMDLLENAALRRFSQCALTKKRCIPPLPADRAEQAALEAAVARVQAAPPSALPRPDELLTGRWFVTLGRNAAFDRFPCQRHDFDASAGGGVKAHGG